MKKRKWHKITAALATVAVILSSPGITDLVKGSSTEFVDIVPISEETIPASENEENISRATEDFSDTTEDFFETTEEPEENFGSETAAEEGSENKEADSVDCIEDFSCEDTSNTENVSPDSASAVTVLQKADETENTELAQGEVHKAKISSSVPEGQEAAKVRLYLTDAQNENPVTDLKITLSSGESTQEIIKDPVQLPEALNQNEPLTVTPVTEYQLDEDGDYVTGVTVIIRLQPAIWNMKYRLVAVQRLRHLSLIQQMPKNMISRQNSEPECSVSQKEPTKRFH